MTATTVAVLAASVFQLLAQAAAAKTVSRSVPSDFFEDASATLARTGGEAGGGAPYDVGSDSVPLLTEYESPSPWKIQQDSIASAPRSGPLSLAAAKVATSASAAAATPAALAAPSAAATRDDVNEDAPSKQQALLQQQLQQMEKAQEMELLLKQQQQQQQQQQQKQLQLQQQQLQQQRQEMARQQQQKLQAEQQQRHLQAQESLKRQQAQQKQALLQQQKHLQEMQRRQPLEQTVAATKAEDPATEAASFFEAQGDLAGKDPLSFSEVPAPADASVSIPVIEEPAVPAPKSELEVAKAQLAAANAQFAQDQKPKSADVDALAAVRQSEVAFPQSSQALPQSSSVVEQELAKLHEQQRYLEMLSRSLSQNASSQAPAVATQQAALPDRASTFLSRDVEPSGAVATSVASGVGLAQRKEEEYMPRHEDCTPRCAYKCTNPTCEEECQPHCDSPKCQTRCTGTELSGCRMQCGQPHCSVVCPSKMCSGPGCQQCTTKCSEPMCMLQCPKAQPCHNVCEQPRCLWQCKAPTSCPKPKCDMVCESPKSCTGSTYRELPPLKAGELSVMSFTAPSALISQGDGAATTQAPLLQTQAQGSFLETSASSALRGSYSQVQQQQQQYPSSSSLLHVPVESMPVETAVVSPTPWPANMGGQRSYPQAQQWTAHMPVTLARGMRDDYAAQQSQAYLPQDAAGAGQGLYGYSS